MFVKSAKSTVNVTDGHDARRSFHGLGCLSGLSQLHISKRIKSFNIISGFEYANMYRVRNSMGQSLFEAYEVTSYHDPSFWGNSREIELHVYDNFNRQVMNLKRPSSPCCCANDGLFPCGLNKMEVFYPFGRSGSLKERIGLIQQKYWPFRPKFNITNKLGNVLIQIVGPTYNCFCCHRNESPSFSLLSGDGEKLDVGRILPLTWQRLADDDYFMVEFPLDLDVMTKTLIFAACFLITIVFYGEN